MIIYKLFILFLIFYTSTCQMVICSYRPLCGNNFCYDDRHTLTFDAWLECGDHYLSSRSCIKTFKSESVVEVSWDNSIHKNLYCNVTDLTQTVIIIKCSCPPTNRYSLRVISVLDVITIPNATPTIEPIPDSDYTFIIMGVVIGSVVLLLIIVCYCLYYYSKRRDYTYF